jgi:hypothetical protein
VEALHLGDAALAPISAKWYKHKGKTA